MAMQLEQGASLILTSILVAVVASHVLLLLSGLKLHAYAPTCMVLSDPPIEFAPFESPELVVVETQLEHGTSLTRTLNPLAVVAADVLRLMASELRLHAYAPM